MSPLPSVTACLVEAAGRWRRWVWLAAFNLLVLSQALGAPGDLDLGFGSGGKVTTAIGSGHDYGYSVAVQSDGKIVVAGYSSNGSNDDFALVRYTASGALDPSFGSGGKVTTAIGSSDDIGLSVAVQGDGRIIVAGYSLIGTNSDFALVRYTAAGTLDTSFGNGGKVSTPIGSGNDYGRSVAVQSDGKIVVAGSAQLNGITYHFALARYTAAGALDTSFGSSGKVTTAIQSSNAYGRSVAVQSDGKIVVAGMSSNGDAGNNDFALARYTPAGALDASFGSGGKVTTPIGSSGDDWGYSVAMQSDGKIVVAGYSANASFNYDFALVRYTAAGAPDASFGSGGKVTTAIGSSTDQAYSVAVQSDGKIIVAGWSLLGTSNFALVRYTAAGALDTSFGSGGKVTTPIGYGCQTVAVQSDGKIVVAGYSAGADGSSDFALVRYEGGGLAALANRRLTYFGTADNSGNAADGAAPDGDGIVNLIKYGLVIAPGTSGASSLPQGQRKVYAEGARLALVFLHDPARNDINLEVQAADDPEGPWTTVASSAGGAVFSGAGFVSETPAGGGLNTVEVRDIVNLDAAPHRYMHIKVMH